MPDTKPNNRHLTLTTQTMRWILVIVLFFAGLGAFPVGNEESFSTSNKPVQDDFQHGSLDVFHFDFSEFTQVDFRVRTNSPSTQRIKNDRFGDSLILKGFDFLVCKIEAAYSEIYSDKYLRLLFQYAIQVNAP
jgi:hypothetical protein